MFLYVTKQKNITLRLLGVNKILLSTFSALSIIQFLYYSLCSKTCKKTNLDADYDHYVTYLIHEYDKDSRTM